MSCGSRYARERNIIDPSEQQAPHGMTVDWVRDVLVTYQAVANGARSVRFVPGALFLNRRIEAKFEYKFNRHSRRTPTPRETTLPKNETKYLEDSIRAVLPNVACVSYVRAWFPESVDMDSRGKHHLSQARNRGEPLVHNFCNVATSSTPSLGPNTAQCFSNNIYCTFINFLPLNTSPLPPPLL